MAGEVCQCGFGEEYFTFEDAHSICTICGGRVVVEAGKEAEPAGEPAAKLVLIVDDQPFFRERIREALGGRGHGVLEAGEGVEAVAALARSLVEGVKDPSRRIDLVVLDLTMPGLIDGFQTLGVMKAIAGELPVIILTSIPPTKELLKKLSQLKAKKYLNKASQDLEGLLLKNIEDA